MVEPKYQTFWPRLWAAIIDALVFSFSLGVVNSFVYEDSVPIVLRSIWYVVSAFSFVAYVVFMHARCGQTIGKMATGIKVLDLSESKLSAWQALLRESVSIVLITGEVICGLTSVLAGEDPARTKQVEIELLLSAAATSGWVAAELLTMLSNSKRRSIHDFIARSVVVRDVPNSRRLPDKLEL